MSTEKCPKCGQAKTPARAGSLTQWIAICGCDKLQDIEQDDRTTIEFCAICGKRISNERKGSLTQFIFRSDLCQCKQPEFVKRVDRKESDTTDSAPKVLAREVDENKLREIAREFSLEYESFPFDRYTPLRVMGEGASGVVYLATDRILKKNVAIKCLHLLTANQLVSFQNEARATSKLTHEGIVTVYDFGATAGGVPYMVMEFVDGKNLADYLSENGRLAESSSVHIAIQAAEALSHAHSHSVFHRDVKPTNILLCGDVESNPAIKIIDFGVAKSRHDGSSPTLTSGKTLIGTPLYMAPDLARGLPYTEASEVYSLGCTLFECLTGRPPFQTESSLLVVRDHLEKEPPLLSEILEDVNSDLEAIVSRCLMKSPAERFSSMTELVDALRGIQEDQLTSAVSVGQTDLPNLFVREQESIEEKPTDRPARPSISPKQLPAFFAVFALVTTGCAVAYFATRKPSEEAPAPQPVPAFKLQKRDRFGGITQQDKDFVDTTFESMDLDARFLSEGEGTIKKLKAFMREHRTCRTILIRGEELTDKEIPLVVKLRPSLLSLTDCPNITDQGLQLLSKAISVTNLTLDQNPQFTPKGLRYLTLSPVLDELSIKNCDLDDEDLKALSRLKQVTSLDIRDNPKVTAEGLKALGSAGHQRYLRIGGCAAATLPRLQVTQLQQQNNLRIDTKPSR